MERQKRVIAVNDLTGFGRCSLTVDLPVLSAMGFQCCPAPTAILSNHVGFDRFYFDDYTRGLPAYLAQWKRLGLSFDGICTGFLGSQEQINLVMQLIRQFASQDALVLIDPVMGEDGVIPAPYTDALCLEMRRLVALADVITPNLTEAAKLSGQPYDPSPDDRQLREMGEKLLALGCGTAIITGIRRGEQVGNLIIGQRQPPAWIWNRLCGPGRVGTGDLFSAIVFGSLLRRQSVQMAVAEATRFIETVLRYSEEQQLPVTDGICFEPYLWKLHKEAADYEIHDAE